MKINISASKLKTFLDCQWAYFAKYHLKIEDEGNDKTRLGSLLHEILELLADPKKAYRIKYIKLGKEKKILNEPLNRLYKKLLIKYKIPQFNSGTKEIIDLHALGIKLLMNALADYDLNAKVIAVEKHFDIPLNHEVSINGFIDKIWEISGDTIELVDYKSGVPFNSEKCDKEFQPYIYKIACETLYPDKNHIFAFHFLKNKAIITVTKSKEQLEKFKAFIIQKSKEMLKLNEKNATCTKSWVCAYCKAKEPIAKIKYTGCPLFFDKNGKSRFKR